MHWPASLLDFILCRHWQAGSYKLLGSLWVLSVIYSVQDHHFISSSKFDVREEICCKSIVSFNAFLLETLGSVLCCFPGFPVPRAQLHPHTKWPSWRPESGWLKLKDAQPDRSWWLPCNLCVNCYHLSNYNLFILLSRCFGMNSFPPLLWDRDGWSGALKFQGPQCDPRLLGTIHTKDGCADLSTFPQFYPVTPTEKNICSCIPWYYSIGVKNYIQVVAHEFMTVTEMGKQKLPFLQWKSVSCQLELTGLYPEFNLFSTEANQF